MTDQHGVTILVILWFIYILSNFWNAVRTDTVIKRLQTRVTFLETEFVRLLPRGNYARPERQSPEDGVDRNY